LDACSESTGCSAKSGGWIAIGLDVKPRYAP
jgi:hypothetical protein